MINLDILYGNLYQQIRHRYSDDVAQDTVTRVWEADRSGTVIRDLEDYAWRTASRLSVSHWRTTKRLVFGEPVVGKLEPTQQIRAELGEVLERYPDCVAAFKEQGGEGHPANPISTNRVKQSRARRRVREELGG